ncbi:hypothetical protein BK412_15955 [Vibrio campbellii]|uniref:hypothetical protein n=1 Tax=Vibrio campbellii TaxID=680 RepID=UPI0009C02A80|nr:hypothetical protein [Vibrio campbellii]OQQ01855.1 hypothetical protein BK412_15955 [Vibrio campbellii]
MKFTNNRFNFYTLFSFAAITIYFWLYIVMYWFGVKGVIPFEIGVHRVIVNLLFVGISIIFFIESLRNNYCNRYNIVFSIFIAYISFIILSHHYLEQKLSDTNGVSVMKYTIYIVVQYVVCFFIGKFFFIPFSEGKRLFTLTGHIICTVILIFFMSENGIIIDVTDMEHGQKGIYLFTSEYIAFFSFLLVASADSRAKKVLTISICSLLIFCFISRSALFIFIFSTWVLYFDRYKYTSIALMIFVAVLGYLNIEYLYDNYPRMFFFIDYVNDASFQGRELQKDIGYESLLRNLFWGDYGGQVKTLGYVGEYIHNIFSYWRQFGIIGFLLIVFLVFIEPIRILIRRRFCKGTFEYRIVFMMSIYVFLQVLFSRSFAWPFVFLYIGLISTYVSDKKYSINAMGKNI